MTANLKFIVVGLGVQGYKRKRAAGNNVVATIDTVNSEATYKNIQDISLSEFDGAFVCTPDEEKIELLTYLLNNGKHVLVEKPLLTESDDEIETLKQLATKNNAVCYTAYNHRFEPHFVNMKRVLDSGKLGDIYSLRMFYGNGTARLVRDSAWRDQGAGVLPDLGSHLLDTLRFWLGDNAEFDFSVSGSFCHENKSFDHVILGASSSLSIQLEMMMLSWRNHFTCDLFAEKGSVHIESLCKWGPSKFIQRERVLPSGRPPEEIITLVQDDPTWELEYKHFYSLCNEGLHGNLENDIWLNKTLRQLSQQAGIASILPTK